MKTAVISYNPISEYRVGVVTIEGRDILILPKTFNPNNSKSPENVLPTDPNWIRLVSHKDELERVVIFAGKIESGSLEIINLAATSFEKKRLCFLLCPHGLQEKEALLQKLGFLKEQYPSFSDGHYPCGETPFLLGLAVFGE